MGRASGFPGIDVKTSASTCSAMGYPKTPIYLDKLDVVQLQKEQT